MARNVPANTGSCLLYTSVNDLEIAQTLATYQGMVPEKLLLAQVPFVEDAEAAGKLLNRERAEAANRQREALSLIQI